MSDNREKPTDGLRMKYFVLKPAGDDIYAAASRRAMRMYSDTVEEKNPELAKSLRDWADNEWVKTPAAKDAAQAMSGEGYGR